MAKKKSVKKAPKKAPRKKQAPPPLHYIHEALRPLAQPLDSVTPNPDNPVKHDDAAIAAAVASLETFDMRQVLVVRESDRVIVDGHARYEAAQRLGWSHLPMIFVDDDEAKTIAYAVATRATVELSDWIEDELLAKALSKVHKLDADLFDVLGLGALCEQAGTALANTAPLDDAADDAGPKLPAEVPVVSSYQVVVECRDEAHQEEIYEGLTEAGHNCKCLTI